MFNTLPISFLFKYTTKLFLQELYICLYLHVISRYEEIKGWSYKNNVLQILVKEKNPKEYAPRRETKIKTVTHR